VSENERIPEDSAIPVIISGVGRFPSNLSLFRKLDFFLGRITARGLVPEGIL